VGGPNPEQHALPLDGLEPATSGTAAVTRAFGAENRARLLNRYFHDAGPVTFDSAWQHTYRLLLWIDQTTGLAHCYESDKCQPGKPWYPRSLAFHDWLSTALGVPSRALAAEIDLLFKGVTADLAHGIAARQAAAVPKAAAQRAPYAGRNLPEPGEDPELAAILLGALEPYAAEPPPADVVRELTGRIRAQVGQEYKRKNLLGEGFEDSVAAILNRLPNVGRTYEIRIRPPLHHLPGFSEPRGNDKARKVDLALLHRRTGHRTLVSCKWSVRSDREEQYKSEFGSYAAQDLAGQQFDHVFLTNEFDPARLAAACEAWGQNAPLFSSVVHVNPEGLTAAYGAAAARRRRNSESGQDRTARHLESGRLTALSAWLSSLDSGA
jgi:hypothetical protein